MKGRGRGSCQQAVSIATIAALAAAALTGAAAQESAAPAHASAAHGKAISYTCLGCHGIDDYKNAYPMYSVPKLEGQNPEYLAAALHGYRDGDRSHLTMHSQASTLSDKDMDDIAAYFAGKPLAPTGKAQGSVPQAATLCVSCHGQDGVAIATMYRSLRGQHEDYRVRARVGSRTGGRRRPGLQGFSATLR